MALHAATLLADKGIQAPCQICEAEGYRPVRAAKYDLPTAQYRWVYACHSHAHQYGRKVGKPSADTLMTRLFGA